MRIIRIVLQFILGLFAVLMLLQLLSSETYDYISHILILGMFIFLILLLGPWWKYISKIDKYNPNPSKDKKSRYFAYLVSALGVPYSFYKSWIIYNSPDYEYQRWEASIFLLLGKNGVVVAWSGLGVIILIGIIEMALRYKDLKLKNV